MLSVFIVDDSEIIQERLVTSLSKIPSVAVVGAVGTQREALEYLQKTVPDVVVLDLELSDGTGYDVLRELRTQPDRPIFVVFTRHDAAVHRIRSLELGADLFLDKAHEFTVLADFVSWLARQQRTSEEVGNR
ncbi:MAG TPA: response regulator transcription factor [Bacteroidota bacterium]|nr:response regulator transcription factor [Bacteroidota bacterium]